MEEVVDAKGFRIGRSNHEELLSGGRDGAQIRYHMVSYGIIWLLHLTSLPPTGWFLLYPKNVNWTSAAAITSETAST